MNNKTGLQDEHEFRCSIKTLARMYDMREREATETAWADDLREAVLDGTDSTIRHVEREIIDYVLKTYGSQSISHSSDQLEAQAPPEIARQEDTPEASELPHEEYEEADRKAA